MATTVKEELDRELEVLEPSAQNKDWTFTDGEITRVYTQKPISFFRKIEFLSLIGNAVDSLSDSGKPLNLAEMFSGEATVDSFVAIISRVAAEIPETLQDAYCIFLDVPKNEREWFKWVSDRDLSDNDGFDILERFVEQNAEDMQDFFANKGQKLVNKITKKFGVSGPVPSSKASKPTARNTAQASKKS